MEVSTLLPLLLTGASTGLTCGLSCGACGNPMVNVFLASYLFTHTKKMKQSLMAFVAYHLGKATVVSLLCLLISWFGSQIVDDAGNLFGIPLKLVVYIAMLCFMVCLLIRWIVDQRKHSDTHCSGGCGKKKQMKTGHLPMFLYGALSGLSPCASLLVILSYASVLTTGKAILVGLSFSLANSVVPLILLTLLTGLLSEQMHKEIPDKIRYFQLATYLIFAGVLIKNLILMI